MQHLSGLLVFFIWQNLTTLSLSSLAPFVKPKGYERFAGYQIYYECPSLTIGYLPFYQEINRPIDIEQAVIFRHSCSAKHS
jgi:hypothetical protein